MDSKSKKYIRLYDQLKGLLEKSPHLIAQLATINAILYHKNQGFFWVGFYLLEKNRLFVGPYQGPVACQELAYSKGVCWASILKAKSIVVEDVEAFPDHIACDARSKSEIVIPIFNSKGQPLGVLDIDSDKKANFDESDRAGLEKIVSLLNPNWVDQIE